MARLTSVPSTQTEYAPLRATGDDIARRACISHEIGRLVDLHATLTDRQILEGLETRARYVAQFASLRSDLLHVAASAQAIIERIDRAAA